MYPAYDTPHKLCSAMRWCIVQTNQYDLQAKTYPIICTHQILCNNDENKIPVFPESKCNEWQNMM